MAQLQPQVDDFWSRLAAPYPPPPPFWKQFTTANIDRLKELEAQPDFDPDSLPYELLVLRPPQPPTGSESYTTFDQTHSIVPQPTLPPEHEELLFNAADLTKATGTARPHARLLWQLTKSLNLNFLELFTIMADNPSEYQDKINDIGMLTENINAVLNLLRPHQAREQLKTILLDRLDAGNDELQRCDDMRLEVEEFLKKVETQALDETSTDLSPSKIDGHNANNTSKSRQLQKQAEVKRAEKMWEILDETDGD